MATKTSLLDPNLPVLGFCFLQGGGSFVNKNVNDSGTKSEKNRFSTVGFLRPEFDRFSFQINKRNSRQQRTESRVRSELYRPKHRRAVVHPFEFPRRTIKNIVFFHLIRFCPCRSSTRAFHLLTRSAAPVVVVLQYYLPACLSSITRLLIKAQLSIHIYK